MFSSDSKSDLENAYVSLMRGIKQLDLRGPSIPCDLVLTGDHAFPLAMNKHGQVLLAASMYGLGRIVVLGHEAFLGTLTDFVGGAISWLKQGKSQNISVGVHVHSKHVAEKLHSKFQFKVMNDFSSDQGIGVYVTDAYCVESKAKDIIEFMKSGGGVLIAGQAWSWAEGHPKDNTLLQFMGNKVSGVAGVYFSRHKGDAECIPVYPKIPASWMSVLIGRDFEDDLDFLLQGISEFDLMNGVVASEILIHGPLAFPIGTTPDGRAFLAGAYYGQGRVVVISHEGLLKRETLAHFFTNALHWLDEGRQGVIGVVPELDQACKVFKNFGLNCEKTKLRKDLSVYVCTAYKGDQIEEIQEFVAEGGGLLLGGHAWHWAQCNKDKNYMTEFAGNKLLNKMGMTLLEKYITDGTYKPPIPSQALKDTYHFRHVLCKFAGHVTKGEELSKHEEEWLTKLSHDCTTYLHLDTSNNYNQILHTFTEIIKKAGLPQACESCPVKTPRDKCLLNVGTEVYKACQNKDELLPYLIKDNPLLPVIYNHRVSINVDTAGGEEWVSTGLYLSPGMKTYISIPASIVDKKWNVQIGCQMDNLMGANVLKRAPRVCERFPVSSEMMLVHNLWGGLIYLVAPPNTQVQGVEVVVQMAVPVPYYKSGVTSLLDWQLLRTAPSPWAELEFENIILTVPSEVIWCLDRPDELAALWDTITRAIADLAVIPHKFKRKERVVCDVQISHGWMHAGYPIMAHREPAQSIVNVEHIKSNPIWGFIHELGHNQQRGCWEFPPHTTECTCNLWSLYVHETVLGFPREQCHPAMSIEKRRSRTADYVKNGGNLKDWNTFVALETYVQLIEKFGWDSIKKVFAAYHTMNNVPKDNKGKMNLYCVTFSETVGMDLTGFFKAWAWPIEGDTEKKLSKLPTWSNHPMTEYK
ncbi:TRPM8 channel-associated factor homolog [Periophthalmus magnuspinnatus]|uniref:TRPM8 channel-associated factor homolog n=1 Tax=Periophthalmus magnuspinnatus TaxID=409849 RepID=UPI00145AF949|nr:TRPM8 channel-associated factor homolog [Periophthalmus magnuspinnatus]XP_055081895.1 TRPM8 channel-associated factor homolog [Periophthalmus magnuspinnatus]